MTHLTDNTLRAFIDDELDDAECAAADRHLESCPDCRRRLDAVTTRAARVGLRLALLAPAQTESPQRALAQLKDRQRKETHSMIKRLFAPQYRPAWIGLAAVVALAFALTLPPVQVWATNFLGLFRVQQIEVVEIDPSRLEELGRNSTLSEQIGKLFSDSFTVIQEPGDPVVAANAEEASALAGFTVRLPANRTDAPTFTVQGGAAFEFTVDRDRAQAILNDAGLGETQLPASLDGAPIAVSVPASVSAAYGGCPDPNATPDESETIPWSELQTCIIFAQMPSPTVTAPPDLDIAQLANIGLQFMGMSPDEASHLSQSIDWATTLVIPLPRDTATVEDVAVDGVAGTLLTHEYEGYVLLWVKDGIVHAISGYKESADALAMANSLK